MKITILTAGSRGDIQPYLALAKGLKHQGYEVKFAANSNFAGLASEHKMDFYPIQVDSYEFTQSPQAQVWLESNSILKLALSTARAIRPVLGQLLTDTYAASMDSDVIVYHRFTMPFVYYFAKYLRIPSISASIYPLPTGAHPALPVNLQHSPGRSFNRLTHSLVDQFAWLVFLPAVRAFLRGKEKVSFLNPYSQILKDRSLVICGYSPSVVPAPEDLPDHSAITGYWFLDSGQSWHPTPQLTQFLESGPKPVFIGFGSMGNPARNQQTADIIFQALKVTGQRAILGAGWSGLKSDQQTQRTIFQVPNIPFEHLFPQLAAIVHHGGAGTTSLALRAGKPNVVVPHFSDNYFWGRRVAQLGVGPTPIPRNKLSAGRLAEAISIATTNVDILNKARVIGQRIRNENGVQTGVQKISDYLLQLGFPN